MKKIIKEWYKRILVESIVEGLLKTTALILVVWTLIYLSNFLF